MRARSYERELMDAGDLPARDVHSALRELAVINRFLGGWSTSRRGLLSLMPADRDHVPCEVLDIGAGGGDVVRMAARQVGGVQVTTLDMNEQACRYQEATHGAGRILCGDALTYPFREESFDIVHMSLFLHHFDEEAIQQLLIRYLRISRIGIVVNDLQRSTLALAGIRVLTSLLSGSRYVRNDGPLSVRRAFTRAEILALCSTLPCASFAVQWCWAFRWLVIIRKKVDGRV